MSWEIPARGGTAVNYKSPDELLTELGIDEPHEIQLEAIAQYCGATILYEYLEGCEARIVGNGDRAIISVNKNSMSERQRFSAGHELGHWMCDRGKIAFACTKKTIATAWFEDNPERRANQFAVELLLPARMFCPRVENRDVTLETAKLICGVFKTSLTATAIRLVELGSYPSLVVCYDSNGRKWYKLGPEVPKAFKPHKQLHKNTVAFELLHKPESEAGRPEVVGAEAWFNVPGSENYEVIESTLRMSDGMTLSVVWWKNQKQLSAFSEEEEPTEPKD